MKDESATLAVLIHPSAFLLPPSPMGALGFEPRTSALSELRSSQLSYAPGARHGARHRASAGKQKSQTHRGLALPCRQVDRASTSARAELNSNRHAGSTLTGTTAFATGIRPWRMTL